MECIEVVDLPAGKAGVENDIIVEETLPGYTLRGKILRVARVKVGRNNNEKSTNILDNENNT